MAAPTRGSLEQDSAIEFPEELKVVFEVEPLKDLERQNPLAYGDRRERVAEHSWHIAIMAILLQDHADEKIDLGRAVALAVVHDVVEQWVGDTFAFGEEIQDQYSREHSAMQKLGESTRSKGVHRLIELWQEYEDQSSATARFVKGLDAFLPIAQNYNNLNNSSWRKHDVEADKVRARLSSHGRAGAMLVDIGNKMISQAQQQHYLR